MKTTNLTTYILGLLLLLCANACGDCTNPKPNDPNEPTGNEGNRGGKPQGGNPTPQGGSGGGAPTPTPNPAPGPGNETFTQQDIQEMISQLSQEWNRDGVKLLEMLTTNNQADKVGPVDINVLQSVMESAIKSKKVGVLKFLLEKSKDIKDIKDMKSMYPVLLDHAIRYPFSNEGTELRTKVSSIETLLLDKLDQTNINLPVDNTKTKMKLLIRAMDYERFELTKQLLAKGADPKLQTHSQGELDRSAFFAYVTKIAQYKVIDATAQELLTQMLKDDNDHSLINLPDASGNTALLQAVTVQNVGLAKILIQNGANPLLQNPHNLNKTPLDLATSQDMLSALNNV